MKPLVGLLMSFALLGCASRPPEHTVCSPVNVDTAECVPSDPGKDAYDVRLRDLLGYQCMSPEDVGEWIKYVKSLLREVERKSVQ